MSRVGSSVIFVIIYILAIVLRGARKPKSSSSTAAKPAPTTGRTAAAAPALKTKRNRKDDDCEYGEINHRFSHASDRRVAQLDGYLKAGLIDKKEYAQMLERYTRQDQIYQSYNDQ